MINGFKISKTKTQCVHFCQLRKMHKCKKYIKSGRIRNFSCWQVQIPQCFFFNKKLSFIPHIQYLKEKCSKMLKLLWVIAHKNWGADQHTLLKLYRISICPKIDYSCFIYGVARKSYLKSLQTVYHEGLRVILGAFRTSPVEILYSEAYEPPLKHRFTKLGLQYYSKLKSLPFDSAYDCTFIPYN